VIYGHNMKNGSMFAVINKYKKEDFYKEHKDVWIMTPYWERKYQIISVHPAQDGSETYAVAFEEGQYEQHIASEVSQSLYDTGTGYNKEMPMVTLSTCTGRGLLDRMVLICQPVYETKLNPFIKNVSSVSENDLSKLNLLP
ncbi:MAG: class B sortase, partial [Lachnospiraceae bacterium]|nr:class B sortase [Lachnospiraceae bacterium]